MHRGLDKTLGFEIVPNDGLQSFDRPWCEKLLTGFGGAVYSMYGELKLIIGYLAADVIYRGHFNE